MGTTICKEGREEEEEEHNYKNMRFIRNDSLKFTFIAHSCI